MRVVVIGAGYAAEGQIHAFRRLGCDILAVCGRDQAVVESVAKRLAVGEALVDWSEAITRLRPDIVCLATPGALRLPVIELAAGTGAHVFCDKPLGTTAAECGAAVRLVEPIRHAYGATRRYEPSVRWLAKCLQGGAIGQAREIDFRTPTCLAPVVPWSWALRLDLGGGLLNNHFPHLLSILETVVGSPAASAAGSARFDIASAPYVEGLHDFREVRDRVDQFSPDELDRLEWRPCDADTSYSCRLTFENGVQAVLVSGPESGVEAARMTITGDDGFFEARGELSFEVYLNGRDRLPLPGDAIGTDIADRYAALARQFLADIRGEAHEPYLSFHDGLRYQRLIECVRVTSGP